MKIINTKNFTTPFNDLLGIKVERLHKDGVTVRMTVRDDLRNMHGGLHGGATATLVDVAVGIGAVHALQGRRQATTVELKLNYFLPISEGVVRARSRMLRVGSSLAIGSVEVRIAGKRLAAFGVATYKLLD